MDHYDGEYHTLNNSNSTPNNHQYLCDAVKVIQSAFVPYSMPLNVPNPTSNRSNASNIDTDDPTNVNLNLLENLKSIKSQLVQKDKLIESYKSHTVPREEIDRALIHKDKLLQRLREVTHKCQIAESAQKSLQDQLEGTRRVLYQQKKEMQQNRILWTDFKSLEDDKIRRKEERVNAAKEMRKWIRKIQKKRISAIEKMGDMESLKKLMHELNRENQTLIKLKREIRNSQGADSKELNESTVSTRSTVSTASTTSTVSSMSFGTESMESSEVLVKEIYSERTPKRGLKGMKSEIRRLRKKWEDSLEDINDLNLLMNQMMGIQRKHDAAWRECELQRDEEGQKMKVHKRKMKYFIKTLHQQRIDAVEEMDDTESIKELLEQMVSADEGRRQSKMKGILRGIGDDEHALIDLMDDQCREWETKLDQMEDIEELMALMMNTQEHKEKWVQNAEAQALEAENKQLREDLSTSQAMQKEKSNGLLSSKSKETFSDQEEKVHILGMKLEELRSKMSELRNQRDEALNQLDKVRDLIALNENSNERPQELIKKISRDLSREKKTLDVERDEAKMLLRNRQDIIEMTFSKPLQESIEKCETLQTELVSAKSKINDLRCSFDSSEPDTGAECRHCQHLEKQMEYLSKERDATLNNIKKIKNEQAANDMARNKQVQELLDEIAQLTEEKDDVIKIHKNAQFSEDMTKNKQVRELQNEVAELIEVRDDAIKQLQNQQIANETTRRWQLQKMQDLQNQVAKITEEREEVINQAAHDRFVWNTSKNKQIRDLQNEIADLTENRDVALKQLRNQQIVHDAIRRKHLKTIEVLQSEVDGAKSNLQTKQKMKNEHDDEFSQSSTISFTHLAKANTISSHETDEVMNEFRDEQVNIQNLSNVATHNTYLRKLKNKNDTLQEHLKAAKSAIDELLEKIDLLETEVAKDSSQNDHNIIELQNEVKDLRDFIRKLRRRGSNFMEMI